MWHWPSLFPSLGFSVLTKNQLLPGSLRSFLRMPVYELGQDALLLLTREPTVPGNKHTDCWKRVASVLSLHPLYLQKTRYTSSSCGGKWEFIAIDHFNANKETQPKVSFKIYSRERNKLGNLCAISITCTSALLITLMKHILHSD